MKKGRRPRRRPRLKLSDRAGPDQCPVPGENALFPAQIAGFLAVSRPVPVYPVFLNYVVPVHLGRHFQWRGTEKIVIYDDGLPYSFFFEEYTPYGRGICGGIILHGAEDLAKAQYSVHT